MLGFNQQMLEIQENALFLSLVDEGGGDSRLAGPPCSPYAMHVILYLIRQVIVDDVLNVGKVQPLARHISGNQNILLSFLHKRKS